MSQFARPDAPVATPYRRQSFTEFSARQDFGGVSLSSKSIPETVLTFADKPLYKGKNLRAFFSHLTSGTGNEMADRNDSR